MILLGELLQEDFILLEHDDVEHCWRFVSGIATFSFAELGLHGERGFMTPGADVATIHTPVPGFNPNIYKQVSSYFKTLKSENAYWRANWYVTPLEGLSPYEKEVMAGKDTSTKTESVSTVNDNDDETSSNALIPIGSRSISELGVRTEYQTIFKLPGSGCIVFGIHTYLDPLETFKQSPRAAAMIGRSTSQMDENILKYRGLNKESKERIIKYCSSLASALHNQE